MERPLPIPEAPAAQLVLAASSKPLERLGKQEPPYTRSFRVIRKVSFDDPTEWRKELWGMRAGGNRVDRVTQSARYEHAPSPEWPGI
jgi:hypothetical protein